ncbi:MAG: nuclear transport factor 2 family protein [Cellvibrionaceae bacterium]|nr:nuclear transport factor 2 family protein [Cellvibrionaceae bacterium]
MTTLELAKTFINAVQAGDEATMRSCMHKDAGIWHDYDNLTQTVDENIALMHQMIKFAKDRQYTVRRLEELSDGYLQRHTLTVTGLSGKVYTAEAMCIITVKDGKISHIEEFINPATLAGLFSEASS